MSSIWGAEDCLGYTPKPNAIKLVREFRCERNSSLEFDARFMYSSLFSLVFWFCWCWWMTKGVGLAFQRLAIEWAPDAKNSIVSGLLKGAVNALTFSIHSSSIAAVNAMRNLTFCCTTNACRWILASYCFVVVVTIMFDFFRLRYVCRCIACYAFFLWGDCQFVFYDEVNLLSEVSFISVFMTGWRAKRALKSGQFLADFLSDMKE